MWGTIACRTFFCMYLLLRYLCRKLNQNNCFLCALCCCLTTIQVYCHLSLCWHLTMRSTIPTKSISVMSWILNFDTTCLWICLRLWYLCRNLNQNNCVCALCCSLATIQVCCHLSHCWDLLTRTTAPTMSISVLSWSLII